MSRGDAPKWENNYFRYYLKSKRYDISHSLLLFEISDNSLSENHLASMVREMHGTREENMNSFIHG